MPLESYYFNLSSRKWVKSFDDPGETVAPQFGNTDSRDFGVTFLQSIAGSGVQVQASVVAAQIYIADPATPGTVITSATAGTASNNEFPFVLSITGFTTFLSGVTKPKQALVEFRVTTASGVNRYVTYCFIAPNTSSDVVADTSAADRALGASEAAGIYVPKQWPQGMALIVTDEDTGELLQIRIKSREFKFEPLG